MKKTIFAVCAVALASAAIMMPSSMAFACYGGPEGTKGEPTNCGGGVVFVDTSSSGNPSEEDNTGQIVNE